MRKLLLLAVAAVTLFLFACSTDRKGKPRILVFTKTTGFRHSSIPVGQLAIIKLGARHGFDVDTTENAALFNEDSLNKYAAVVFLNTTDSKDSLLDYYQKNAFERYIQAGGGFVGVHAATDAEYHWGFYTRLVGAHFLSHPEQQEAVLNIVDSTHISTKHLPGQWKRKDEWYNFKQLNKDVHVLIKIDEHSYKGGVNGEDHPMAWYHEFEGGRAFYTELGHTEESYADTLYLNHLLGGIQYAIGEHKKLDYANVKTLKTPREEQFSKTILKTGAFFEPTEMTILPNLDILIAQRRGEIMLYKKGDTSLTQAGYIHVYHKAMVNNVSAEEGLVGIQCDPDFDKNHFVYVFYSPFDTSVNRLSRFTFTNNKIDSTSEKIILQFYSQRNICCHTGGSIAFGNDRMLFVSAGDNSTPFDEPRQKYTSKGYAPLDDRKGHTQYDARRSAGNTNDLRGKILRIKIREDGGYDIPEGNLFSKGMDGTRPEIYVMGNRNPYRITVDQLTGFLYWGEVGPDASTDSAGRGPRGYDEINQAKKAGYFGWPLFVGNNYPYSEYDYATGKKGMEFDPAKPVNNSKNNTGLKLLPAAQPAFIYYPYAASPEFPQVGSGGRNAMAGPVFNRSLYSNAGTPAYYDGKLFIYDFIRGWIKVITMLPDGSFDKMEPFMEHTRLNSTIDMEMGPDGKLYVLEYGSGWFSRNSDAALSRIDFDSSIKAKPITTAAVQEPKPSVDSAQFKQGHQQPKDSLDGKMIMANLDCKVCHKTDEKSVGPSFAEVAKKYGKNSHDINYLARKIINGGGGVWGPTVMPAHPALPVSDASKIVEWILSLKKK